MMRRRSAKKSSKSVLRGSIPIQSDEQQLIALLDVGNVEEFRRRMDAERRQRRREMVERVLSGR